MTNARQCTAPSQRQPGVTELARNRECSPIAHCLLDLRSHIRPAAHTGRCWPKPAAACGHASPTSYPIRRDLKRPRTDTPDRMPAPSPSGFDPLEWLATLLV